MCFANMASFYLPQPCEVVVTVLKIQAAPIYLQKVDG